MSTLSEWIVVLQEKSPAGLRAEWRKTFHTPAPNIGPDLLRRGLAYRMQERQLGKLASSTKREIDRIITRVEQKGKVDTFTTVRLKPGTRLIRSWNGTVHQVLVLPNSYEHDGRSYRSLSHVARAITGAHWSGPRFFGLRNANG